MALSRGRRIESVNYWPGFVDALSTMLLVIIFLLSVFMLAQFFLSREVTGKDTALAKLNHQIEELTSLLAMERSQKSEDQTKIADADRDARRSTQAERQRLLDVAAQGGASADAATRQGGRRRERARRAKADFGSARSRRSTCSISRSARCASNWRRSRRRSTLRRASDKDAQAKIADLGQRLNVALAQKVQELSRYRSDFFGRLRQILGSRPDIRVVGDRFVFESSVLFDSAKADVSPAGTAVARQPRRRGARSRARNPARHSLDPAHRRPYRFQGDHRRRRSNRTGSCPPRARSRWCNI